MTKDDFSVLIADDNELNRWLLGEQLQHWTMDITAAKDGHEAWQLLQTRIYSLIFLDLNMPFLSGLELIEKLRTSETVNRSTPAVAVTAHADNRQHQSLIAAGFNNSLVKPILLQHLKQVIEQWKSPKASPEYYAAQIVKKTEFNRELSRQLLNKLFEDMPENLHDIDQAIQASDYQQAWQIAHKLHGTFCFYGFADFLPMANGLEQCLLNNDATLACTQLLAIKERFSALLNDKATILACVVAEAAQDFDNPS